MLTKCRGGICPCRQCQRQCKIFASGVNFPIFTHFLCFFLLKLLRLGEIDGVKFLAWKSGGVKFLTNSMSDHIIVRCSTRRVSGWHFHSCWRDTHIFIVKTKNWNILPDKYFYFTWVFFLHQTTTIIQIWWNIWGILKVLVQMIWIGNSSKSASCGPQLVANV